MHILTEVLSTLLADNIIINIHLVIRQYNYCLKKSDSGNIFSIFELF